jgi:hypothetical protein
MPKRTPPTRWANTPKTPARAKRRPWITRLYRNCGIKTGSHSADAKGE